jgi:hypothetical protein
MTIVLILNVVFSAAIVMAIVGLLGWNIAVDQTRSLPLRWNSS